MINGIKISCACVHGILRMRMHISRMCMCKITKYARKHKQVRHAGGAATFECFLGLNFKITTCRFLIIGFRVLVLIFRPVQTGLIIF